MEQNAVFAGLPATGSGQHNVNVFPSMSVNVSMNMTMHGYPTPMNADNIHAQMPYPQVSTLFPLRMLNRVEGSAGRP